MTTRSSHGMYNDGINVCRLDSGMFALNFPGRRDSNHDTAEIAVAHAIVTLGCGRDEIDATRAGAVDETAVSRIVASRHGGLNYCEAVDES